MEGNGYSVTWALGHLVQLALPGTYGYTRTSGDNLPLLPDPFQLVIRQRKTDRGMATDPVAAKQLRTIDSVFSRCSAIIVATDAGREGELYSGTSIPTWGTRNLSAGFGSPRSRTKPSAKGSPN